MFSLCLLKPLHFLLFFPTTQVPCGPQEPPCSPSVLLWSHGMPRVAPHPGCMTPELVPRFLDLGREDVISPSWMRPSRGNVLLGTKPPQQGEPSMEEGPGSMQALDPGALRLR